MRSLHRLDSPAAHRRRLIFLAVLVVATVLAGSFH
jgi:hypothetical protein